MTRITNEEAERRFNEAFQGGGALGGGIEAAKVGLQYLCEVYRDAGRGLEGEWGTPGLFTQITDQWCPLVPVDPPPRTPFPPGGQCAGVTYVVSGTISNAILSIGPSPFSVAGPGPVKGIGGNEGAVGIQFGPGSGFPGGLAVLASWFPGDPSASGWSINVTSIVPSPPDADNNCGSLPSLPDPPRGPLPPTRNPDYRPPFAPDFSFDVNLPGIDVGPLVEISPSLKVEVGPFNITFDLGGVDINIDLGRAGRPGGGGGGTTVPPNALPPAVPPSPPTPGGGGGGITICPDPCPSLDLSPVLEELEEMTELLEDIKECACEPEGVLQTASSAGRSGTILIGVPDARALYADFSALVVGEGVRNQWGGGQAADVYYIGWYAWTSPTGNGDRLPIHYQSARYYPPSPDVTGISYTLTHQSEGQMTVFYEIPPEE